MTMTAEAELVTNTLVGEVEGEILHPYQDIAGFWTIGDGSRCLLDGTPVTAHTAPITRDMATLIRRAAILKVNARVQQLVKVHLDDDEEGGLTSFVYNIGSGNFEKSTMLRLLNEYCYAAAAAEFPKWNRAGGHVVQGLIHRREMERQVFCGDITLLHLPHPLNVRASPTVPVSQWHTQGSIA